MRGSVRAKVIRGKRIGPLWKIKNAPNIWRGLWRKKLADFCGIAHLYGELYAVVIKRDGTTINYGRISTRAVTDAFCELLVDNLQTAGAALQTFDFHDSGTGTTAEAATQTALVTPSGVARATGTASEATSKTYQSVGTQAYTSTLAITEHGLFSASSAGTLLDRSMFAAINVQNGDSIQFTYQLAVASGG